MDRYTLKDDDQSSGNCVARDKDGNGPQDNFEFRTWEDAMVEEEYGKFDGDHSRVVEDFGGDFRFRC